MVDYAAKVYDLCAYEDCTGGSDCPSCDGIAQALRDAYTKGAEDMRRRAQRAVWMGDDMSRALTSIGRRVGELPIEESDVEG